MQLRIHWQDRDYDYDSDKIDLDTAMVIKSETGWGLKSFSREVDDINPIALRALWFAIRRQGGEHVAFRDCDPGFVMQFYNEIQRASLEAMSREIDADLGKDQEAADESPPTPTPTSESSETPTSSG